MKNYKCAQRASNLSYFLVLSFAWRDSSGRERPPEEKKRECMCVHTDALPPLLWNYVVEVLTQDLILYKSNNWFKIKNN